MNSVGDQWDGLAAMVTRRRMELRLSRRQAAEAAGISDPAWKQLEEGWKETPAGKRVRPNPRDGTLVRVAQVLEIEPAEFFRALGRPIPAAWIVPPTKPDESPEDRLARVLDRIESRLAALEELARRPPAD